MKSHLGGEYTPATHDDKNHSWVVTDKHVQVTPVTATWDRAKIVISREGEIAKWQGRLAKKVGK